MDEKIMPFLEHLEELRWHILKSLGSILIAATIAFLAKDLIFDSILFGPKKQDFFTYKLLCKTSTFLGLDDTFCIKELPFRVQSRTVSGQFSAHIWTSITAGFIVAFPYVLYQLWLFISPGLVKNERKKPEVSLESHLFFFSLECFLVIM